MSANGTRRKSGIPFAHVGYRGKTGKHLLVLRLTGFEPTSDTSQIEIPQRSSLLPGVLSFRFKAREALAVKRREFITLLGGAAAWPLAARAQQPGKLPTIGFLGQSTRSATSEWTTAFVQRLRELGWTDGRNVAIEYRWGEGRNERFAQIAAEFVRLKVDVIVTAGTPQVLAVKQATSVIPIVFAVAGDPVGPGILAGLARPGGR